MKPKPPFDPPTPETSPTTTRAETAVAIAAGFGLVAAEVISGGLVGSLLAIPSVSRDEPGPIDLTALLATIADTSAPVDDCEGNVQCTRCTQFVPYSTMSLNEQGYFCATCAAHLTRDAAS